MTLPACRSSVSGPGLLTALFSICMQNPTTIHLRLELMDIGSRMSKRSRLATRAHALARCTCHACASATEQPWQKETLRCDSTCRRLLDVEKVVFTSVQDLDQVLDIGDQLGCRQGHAWYECVILTANAVLHAGQVVLWGRNASLAAVATQGRPRRRCEGCDLQHRHEPRDALCCEGVGESSRKCRHARL